MSTLINLVLRRTNVTIGNFNSIIKLKNSHLRSTLLFNNRNLINHVHNYSTKFNKSNRFNLNQQLLKQNNELVHCKSIRTTNPNRIPPIFWVAVRPFLNVLALLGGRRFRNWWKNLPDDRKDHYRKLVKKNQRAIYSVLGGLFLIGFIYYSTHIEESPITKRKRFIAFSKDKFNELADLQFELQIKMLQNKLLPNWHPASKKVERVATRIIKSNLDIPEFKDKTWTTAVVDAPIKNAMVVGDGRIFVFTGMLDMCENDDSLGFVLSHEIAHSILSHGIERLSYTSILDIFVVMGIFLLWSILPSDIYAFIASAFSKKAIEILFDLPWTRAMEIEADRVAMLFAAKSCFDVREGIAFWMKMSHFEKRNLQQIGIDSKDINETVEFLSTHPAHDKRAEYLESMLKETLDLRAQCNCPRLPYRNPIEIIKRKIELEKVKAPANYTLIRIE